MGTIWKQKEGESPSENREGEYNVLEQRVVT